MTGSWDEVQAAARVANEARDDAVVAASVLEGFGREIDGPRIAEAMEVIDGALVEVDVRQRFSDVMSAFHDAGRFETVETNVMTSRAGSRQVDVVDDLDWLTVVEYFAPFETHTRASTATGEPLNSTGITLEVHVEVDRQATSCRITVISPGCRSHCEVPISTMHTIGPWLEEQLADQMLFRERVHGRAVRRHVAYMATQVWALGVPLVAVLAWLVRTAPRLLMFPSDGAVAEPLSIGDAVIRTGVPFLLFGLWCVAAAVAFRVVDRPWLRYQ